MRRIAMAAFVPIAAGALLLAGCAGGGSQPEGEVKTLTLGATLDMYGWKPIDQPGYQNWAAEAVWDHLVKCDSVGELQPDIAESWEVSDENRVFTATIREGMEFSDGAAVDAEAVVANFEYSANNGTGADFEGATYEAPDASTVVITFPEPQPAIGNVVCNQFISSPERLASGEFDVPVGSGPYVLDTSATTTGSVYSFTKNENHWNADNYPYERLAIRVLENDAAAVSALKTGQIDATLVETPSIAEVEASGFDIKAFRGQSTRLLLTDHLGEKVPALGDVRVRQAINMVFDKESMVDALYLGNAEPTAQVFREGTPAYIDDLEDPYPFDVEAAQALMAEAGYAEGFALELPTMAGQNFETLMPYVKQQLGLLNIQVTEVPLSGANAIGDLLSGTYPVVLWQLGNLGNSARQIYIESFSEGYWNLSHQPDEYVDSRYLSLGTATPDESAAIQKEINQYQIDQAWFAPMVYTGGSFAYDAEKVSIPTDSDQEGLTPRLADFK